MIGTGYVLLGIRYVSEEKGLSGAARGYELPKFVVRSIISKLAYPNYLACFMYDTWSNIFSIKTWSNIATGLIKSVQSS